MMRARPLEKLYLRVGSPPGDMVFGSFVIGVPIETVLDLKKQYQDRNFAGQVESSGSLSYDIATDL